MRGLFLLLVVLVLAAPDTNAQVREIVPAPSGEVNITFTHPDDQGQAERLRDMTFRVKPPADQLEKLEKINIVLLHSQRELDLRLGPDRAGALAGASYVHGILFLSPLSWEGNPTEEAIENELEEALVRYAILHLTGGYPLPAWLEQGLVDVLGNRPAPAVTARQVAQRADLLLTQSQLDLPVVGYWAVRYLMEERGGLVSIRQLLRLTAQRPDNFLENLQLVYGAPVGELEFQWRAWLERKAEEGDEEVQRGPLIRRN